MEKNERREKMAMAILESYQGERVPVDEALEDLAMSSIMCFIAMSEVVDRKTLRDLYAFRRTLTNVIERYKEGNLWKNN